MITLDGKKVAAEVQLELQALINGLPGRKPCLAVVLIGDHPASKIYVNRKAQACAATAIISIKKLLPADISREDLIQEIVNLNQDPTVDGILVQFPLPLHINPADITQAISIDKDVDGFHPTNVGKMLLGSSDGFIPCTPLGIKTLLVRHQIEVAGNHVVIVGRSNIVGKPMAALLMQNSFGANATVTVAHSHSRNMAELCRSADILIAAVGKPRFITADMVKEGAVIVDVGINKVIDGSLPNGYQIVGDVDYDHVAPKCSHITPVPGGVGPMTIAMLLRNTLYSYAQREGLSIEIP
jgi:methylenetetrahydrofolate dehydrogenase (NADP+)/methenyltetrahydrofolate cyclohydrolase